MSSPTDGGGSGPSVLGNGPGNRDQRGDSVAPNGIRGAPPGSGGSATTVNAPIRPRSRGTPAERSEWARRANAARAANAARRAAGQAPDAPVRLRVDAAPKSTVQPRAETADELGLPGANGEAIAAQLVGLVTATVGLLTSTNAALNPIEQSMIVPPAGRMLARMTPAEVAKYSALMDPISLLAGVAIWGTRVYSIVLVDRAERRRQAEAEARARGERPDRQPDSARAVRTPPEPGAVTLNGHIPVRQDGAAPPPDDITTILEDGSAGGGAHV